MGGYSNGRYPLSTMVKLGDKHYLPAGTAARWRWLQRMAWEKYAVWLIISPGWNAYRPYDVQVQLRKQLGIWAAVPGWSSHGLIFNGRQVAAIDVNNWAVLGWARFKALCRLAGFTVDFVSPQELWHIGDFNDIWTAPAFAAGGSATPVPAPKPVIEDESEEDTMKVFGYKKPGDKRTTYVTMDFAGGLWDEFVTNDEDYAVSVAKNWGGGAPLLSIGHRDNLAKKFEKRWPELAEMTDNGI